MLPFMQMLQKQPIRPYVRFAHHMLQALDIVPRIIFDHEFVWIEKGKGILTVGESFLPYQKGDLLLIPPGTVHALSGPFEAHKAIHFDWEHRPEAQESLDQQIDDGQAGRFRLHGGSLWLPHAIVFQKVGDEIIAAIDEIVDVYQSKATFRSLQLQAAFSRLLLHLVMDVDEGRTAYVQLVSKDSPHMAATLEEKAEITGLADQLMTRVEKADVDPGILQELMQPIPLGEAQIRRLFKRQFGYTPHMYVTLLCMNKARKLLQEGSKSVQEISFSCGYEDAKYFSRLFRKLEGVAPAEFRELHRLYRAEQSSKKSIVKKVE
ncbi:hypothetical protein A8709_21310 [Paenibacillus pectinilyticus]|uniref:HTH araC/xylS-type domain-containing protein n=1 Tax=Paenibacillus pectinilyticus TaxID=512399 RepID=A0A1C0ZXN8_9BACL|nr:helix-turn-helix domain-containing protein [Paenibacillus pectinilyticus]OCT12873.1 hypothetical protein A8709_21310 [Paenibacillus pectinilyticus]